MINERSKKMKQYLINTIVTINQLKVADSEILENFIKLEYIRKNHGKRSCKMIRKEYKIDDSKSLLEENIYLWGTSIGAVAALSCAAKVDSIKAIIADSCFADIPEMASRLLKKTCPAFIVFKPGSMCIGRQFFGMGKDLPIDNASRISCPILFINGTEDSVIPEEDTYRLFSISRNPVSQIWIVSGADHSKSFITSRKEYVAKVISFLNMSKVENNSVQ